MEFYTLLFLCSSVLFIITFFAWKKTNDISIVIGFLVIYYFTFYGAWEVIADALDYKYKNGDVPFHYLYYKLFKVDLDTNYFTAIVYYTVFTASLLITLLLRVKPLLKTAFSIKKIQIPHSKVILISSGFLLFFVMSNFEYFAASLITGQSAYGRQRTELLDGPITIAGNMCFFSSLIGFLTCIAKENTIYLENKVIDKVPFSMTLSAYAILLTTMYFADLLLGNRVRLLQGLIFGFLFYLKNTRGAKLSKVFLCVLVVFPCISIVSILRGIDPTEIINQITDVNTFTSSIDASSQSIEKFAAHMSMYGTLKYNIPITYGSSILFSILAFIPKVIISERPLDSYEVYAQGVGAPADQGFTVHPAAAWYINFGFIGLLIGGALIGYIWAFAMNSQNRYMHRDNKSIFNKLVAFLAPCIFVSLMPAIMRNGGPEVIKSILIEMYISFPLIIITAHTVNKLKQ